MKLKQRRSRSASAITAVVAAFALVVTGCSSTDNPEGAEQELVVATPQSIKTLDATQELGQAGLSAFDSIYDTLVKFKDKDLVPSVAESWTNPDDLTWVFTIRDDVTFHDGTELTADDVVASIERFSGDESGVASAWTALDTVSASGPLEVTFTTLNPSASFLATLATGYIMGPANEIYEPRYYDAPNGPGPFMVSSFVPDQDLLLEANPNYFLGAPTLQKLKLSYIPEQSSAVSSLINGDVEFAWNISSDQAKSLESSDAVSMVTVPGWSFYLGLVNHFRPPLDDARVRQALYYAVDFEAIQKSLFGDTAEVATAPLAAAIRGAAKLEPYPYDPKKAQALLAEAGYPDGLDLSVKWQSASGASTDELMQALISYWAESGMIMEPLPLERAAWADDAINGNFDILFDQQDNQIGDAFSSLNRFYVCDSEGRARAQVVCDDELDRELSLADASLDEDERMKHYEAGQRIIWDSASNFYPLDLSTTYVVGKNLTGFEPSSSGVPSFYSVSKATK